MVKIKQLEGQEVACICFVRDYLELRFDGPILRFLEAPTLKTESSEIRFPEPGSRDQLCALIGQKLLRIDLEEGRWFEATFGNSWRLSVSLEKSPASLPEVINYAHEDSPFEFEGW